MGRDFKHHPISVRSGAGVSGLHNLVSCQISFFGNLGLKSQPHVLRQGIDTALGRAGYCFSKIINRYYQSNDIPVLDPTHTGQYAIFLYFLSNSLQFVKGDGVCVAAKVYALNKMLHGIDIFYEVQLPDVFFLDHPVGSVIGRAAFSDYFQFGQNCTVGNNHGKYPRFGKNVRLCAGAMVLGDCVIGDNVTISAGTVVKDQSILSNSLVFGRSPDLIIKQQKACWDRFSGVDL